MEGKNSASMLFYHNTEPHRPGELAESVQGELRYFGGFLHRAIKSMDVSRYDLEWEKDEEIVYKVYPTQILEVKKPRNRIFLRIGDEDFSTKKVIMKENEEQIRYETYEDVEDGVVLVLEKGERIAVGEDIWYGRRKVKWEPRSSGFTGRIEYLSDRTSKEYRPFEVREKADHYVVCLRGKERVGRGVDLFVNDVKVDYSEKRITTLTGLGLYDSKGWLDFLIDYERGTQFTIKARREIIGKLKDSNERPHDYAIEEQRAREGVWILLREPEENYISADSDQRTRIDLFLELVSSAMDFEIWERPDVKSRDKDSRIPVMRVHREENRLLLKREPETAKIYPPKSTYQLEMQRNAIRTLIDQPAPEHRSLLRLFEPVDNVEWESPREEFTEESIEWKFLGKKEREGTEQQRDFVLKAMNTPDFALLEGPPGSGKTTAISELIHQLLQEKRRVLLSASTHVAVDNVLEQLDEKFRNKGGAMENGVVPLRIGREGSISRDVVKYQIDSRKEEMTKRLESETWFKKANEEDQTRYIEETVINSSNLVCGTTIGILQFPHFRSKRWGEYVIPEFDYLIVDEASKTTFQEFLVPAIFAKKWIIVGDVKQLSPSTDTLHMRVNLDGVLRNAAKEKALVAFFKLLFDRRNVWVGGKPIPLPRFVYVDNASVVGEILEILPHKIENEKERSEGRKRNPLSDFKFAFVMEEARKAPSDNIETLSEDLLTHKRASLFDKDIVFVEDSVFRRKWGSMPNTHILIHPTSRRESERHEFRHLHWYLSQNEKPYALPLPGRRWVDRPWEIKKEVMNALKKSWAEELSWRMKRVHELSMAYGDERSLGSKGYYMASMHALMPPETDGRTWRLIRKIGQVSLPSILKSIQEGVTPHWQNKEDKTAMSHGLEDSVKTRRYSKLSFQHRMHPEISSIPREIFYKGEALIDDEFVKTDGRAWGYSRYGKRVVWCDVSGANVRRNTNQEEAEVVLKELAEFINWVKTQKSKYTVVLLSFYEMQRKLTRDLLREKYPRNSRRETRFDIEGVDVRNYTVDKVQGREGDFVILSMVQNRRVGFMDSPNRLNVALTRAKYQLVVVGDRRYFVTQHNSYELSKVAETIEHWEHGGGK